MSLCQQNNTKPTFPTPFRKPEEKIESQAESKESEAEVSHQNYVGVNGGVLFRQLELEWLVMKNLMGV